MKKFLNPRLMMIASMATFGTLSIFVRNIPVSSGELALYRAILAALMIAVFLLATKQKLPFANIKKELPLLLISGVAMGINWILLFEAYKYTTVSVATLSYYFAPVIVTIVCPILFKEKLTGKQMVCFVMSTFGLVLITGIGDIGSGKDLIGILFGLGAAVLYATVILLNKFIKNVEGIHRTFLQFLSAIVILIPYVLMTSGITFGKLDGIGWVNLLIVGLIHTGVTYCMYFASLKELPGQKAAILSYIDPLVAVLISVTILGESMTLWQVIGGLLILGFTLWNEISPKNRVGKATSNLLIIALICGLIGCGPIKAAAATPLPQPDDEDLVRVIDYIPTIRQELPYASANNFTGRRIYDFTDAYLRYGTVKKLASVCADLADYGLGLKIWDGYRPLSAQELLWDICPDETYVSNPTKGYRAHCRGNAVDVTLVDLDSGDGVLVPSGFDNFTAFGDRDYSDCSSTTIFHMTLLEELMIRYGFEPYEKEWWHFTDTDDYPLEENFDPAIPGLWAANCQKQMGMFKSLGNATASKRIPAGDTMEFISWRSKFAKVSYKGTIGYVMSSYIKPADDAYLDNCLDIVTPTDMYSYEQMLADISALEAAYPDLITVDSIGSSEFGVDIPVIRMGDKDAEYHILFQGSIHGREHMTTWLLMAMTDYWLSHDIMSYGDVCYHIIPMCNPDGVQISQSRTLNEEQLKIYKNDVRDKRTNSSRADYAALWKANGLGIDLNRNFPCGWLSLDGRTGPSSQNYEGETPFSTAEACALRDYTLRYEFDSTISYHATGSIIFYTYGKKQPVNKLSKDLAKTVQKLTGYDLGGVKETDGAGYKDWAMNELGIPSLTIEVGCQDTPLAKRELYSVFIRNYRVMPTVARWVLSESYNRSL